MRKYFNGEKSIFFDGFARFDVLPPVMPHVCLSVYMDGHVDVSLASLRAVGRILFVLDIQEFTQS